MTSSQIRYRFALLLYMAAMALVTNPVLHAFSHDHTEDRGEATEQVADVEWAEEDLCPYCDAVSQVIVPPVTTASIAPALLSVSVEPSAILYPDLRLRIPTRLRAPPFIA